MNKQKKIGIVTLFNCYNYGAVLQAFATQKYIKNCGFKNVEIINYENKFEKKSKKISKTIFSKNIANMIKSIIQQLVFRKNFHLKKGFVEFNKNLNTSTTKYSSIKELKNTKYDMLISGSDQIWNPKILGGIDPVFFLKFSKNAKKISISSSAGSYKFNENEKQELKNYLTKYNGISVREENLKNQLKNIVKEDIFVSVDPTLLLTKEKWIKELPSNNKYNEKHSKYALIYIVDANIKQYQKEIETLKKRLDINFWLLTPYKFKIKNIDKNIVSATPNDFVSLIDNAQIIITNSFHGSIFSTNFGKKFIALENHKNPARTMDYLKQLSLEKRIVKNNEEAKTVELDYNCNSHTKKLNKLISETKKWIGDHLEE